MLEPVDHCSFCNRSSAAVNKMFSGKTGHICDNCTKICFDMLFVKSKNDLLETGTNVDITPQFIKEKLDQHVMSQEKAKKILSVAVYNHYKRLKYNATEQSVNITKNNVILIGPTGSGKTFLAETMANALNVPFGIADATTLTEAGYVGGEVEDVLYTLLKNCRNKVEEAERGIVYIDEIDKIARVIGQGRDVSGQGVQRGLLKIIEGTTAKVKMSKEHSIELKTHNILFIVGGAFDGIDSILSNRTEKAGIGFQSSIVTDKAEDKNTLRRRIKPEDLIAYGLMPEFIGRIPVIAVLDSLNVDDLVDILHKPQNSLVKQYKALFDLDGINLHFTGKSMKAIAEVAIKRKTGARGLKAILETVLLDIMFESPSYQIEKITITDDIVRTKTSEE